MKSGNARNSSRINIEMINSLKITPIALPNHKSICPLCENAPHQMAWVLGSNTQNLMTVRGSAIIDNTLLESGLCYCPICDFGYFYPAPPREILQSFYTKGGGGGSLGADETALSELSNPYHVRDVNLLFQIASECGLGLFEIRGKKVLEIGPGLSRYMSAFIGLGCEYWANEIGEEISDFIERVFKAPVIRGPLEEIANGYDHSFDLIFTKDSLEHHANPAASIKRMNQLLRRNGWLIISVPNLNSYTFKNASITHPYYAYPPHLNYFSTTAFTKSLNGIGMRNIQVRSFSFSSEIFYCMELCIKMGMVSPAFDALGKLCDSDQNERLLVVAQSSH